MAGSEQGLTCARARVKASDFVSSRFTLSKCPFSVTFIVLGPIPLTWRILPLPPISGIGTSRRGERRSRKKAKREEAGYVCGLPGTVPSALADFWFV